jgi:uncharacterized small protein (DUF1192 family)
MDEDAPRAKPPAHLIGQDLALLSVGDLEERIGLLREEIGRLEAAIKSKRASLEAAGALLARLSG